MAGDATAFLDTNILLYALSTDAAKADRAEALLAGRPVVSVQVLNEFVAVARRKLALPWHEIEDILNAYRRLCVVCPLTVETHESALALAQRHAFAWYDALIVASALGAGCSTLFSEDFQHGLVVGSSLAVCNPFADA